MSRLPTLVITNLLKLLDSLNKKKKKITETYLLKEWFLPSIIIYLSMLNSYLVRGGGVGKHFWGIVPGQTLIGLSWCCHSGTDQIINHKIKGGKNMCYRFSDSCWCPANFPIRIVYEFEVYIIPLWWWQTYVYIYIFS